MTWCLRGGGVAEKAQTPWGAGHGEAVRATGARQGLTLILRVRGSHGGKSSWEDHYPTHTFKGPQDAGERSTEGRR